MQQRFNDAEKVMANQQAEKDKSLLSADTLSNSIVSMGSILETKPAEKKEAKKKVSYAPMRRCNFTEE